MDLKTALSVATTALSVAETVTGMLANAGQPLPAALGVGVKIAQGVVAEVPEAIALFDQFKSGTVPSQAEIDGYAAAEDSAYAKLMADIETASR